MRTALFPGKRYFLNTHRDAFIQAESRCRKYMGNKDIVAPFGRRRHRQVRLDIADAPQ